MTSLVWGVVAGLLGLVGMVFLLVAAVIALTPEIGAAGAWAAVGGGVVVCAGIAALAARPRARRRALAPTFAPPPTISPLSADPSAMKSADRPGKTAMAIAGAALLAGLVLGRRL
jgi:hypothetical protein